MKIGVVFIIAKMNELSGPGVGGKGGKSGHRFCNQRAMCNKCLEIQKILWSDDLNW